MILLPEDTWEVKERFGRGIFAKKDIPAGVVIGDYLGKMIKVSEEDDYEKGKHFYTMYYSDTATIYPYPRSVGIHLLNHSCAPNCWMYTYKGHTLYFAIRHIFAGEELTVSYLLSEQDKDCKPCDHLCHCGALICFQTMHMSKERYDAWEKFHDEEAAKTERERIRFGEDLPKLDLYPASISDNPIYTLFGAKEKYALRIDDKTVPTTTTVRKFIRESGRTLAFPKLNLRIHGVIDNLLISQSLY